MNQQSVVGVYDVLSKAEDAIRTLDRSSFPIKQVSIVAKDLESERDVHGYVNVGDVAKGGARTGAWVGGFFGLLFGAAFLWVPGFGALVVAGPLSAALLGGIEGALAGVTGGGLLGALFGWGVSRQHILKYEERIKGGKYLVIVHGSPEQVERAHGILQATEPEELNIHRQDMPAKAEPVRSQCCSTATEKGH
jgi:hypothetical protein